MEIVWKDIKNYEGYQVSNDGRVRTNNKVTYTVRHGKRKWKDRILKFKGQTYKTGYRVDLWKNGKPKTFLVARLTAFTFYNKDINNKKLTVNHIDGNRFNNNLWNLELISLADNIRHAFETGLMPQKKIKIYDKKKDEYIIFRSMVKASGYMNKCHSYIHANIKRKKYENDNYRWEVL